MQWFCGAACQQDGRTLVQNWQKQKMLLQHQGTLCILCRWFTGAWSRSLARRVVWKALVSILMTSTCLSVYCFCFWLSDGHFCHKSNVNVSSLWSEQSAVLIRRSFYMLVACFRTLSFINCYISPYNKDKTRTLWPYSTKFTQIVHAENEWFQISLSINECTQKELQLHFWDLNTIYI